jgi:uncharacterized membrane protein YhhN
MSIFMPSDDPKPIEIKPDQPAWRAESFGWIVLVIVIAAAVALMLLWLTESILMAIGIAALMIGAMLGMGWLASRNLDGRR